MLKTNPVKIVTNQFKSLRGWTQNMYTSNVIIYMFNVDIDTVYTFMKMEQVNSFVFIY